MSVPQPKGELEGHCSAIHDDTLYVLSPAGFQSLPLKQNATWSQEKTGQTVTGPACVHAKAQQALYVVGGTSDDEDYAGLQKYSFRNKAWETLSPPTNDMRGRTNHSATYLSSTESILVYAGSQPDASSYLSSQTFVIHTQKPYNLEAFTSKAPPANQPILEPWNSSHAVMVGGSTTNKDIFMFQDAVGWKRYSTDLTDAIDPAARGALIDGSDGSKVLEVYNFSESPNTVSQIVLQGADGQPASTGTTIRGSGSSSRKRKRDLSLGDWPSYNSTNAPTATRTDCAVATGPSGLSVISGGNSNLPVALFDQSDNSWVDASDFFNSKQQQPLQPASTSTATPSSTSSAEPSASTTAAAGSGGMTAHQKMLRTLGITLGVIFGVAAVFIAILLFLRWRKMRQKKQKGYIDEKPGNRMSFQDRGASFMKEAGGSVNDLSPPSKGRYNSGLPRGHGSHSSLAIIAGKIGAGSHNRRLQPKDSYESTRHLVGDKNAADGHEPLEMLDIGDKTLARKPVARTEHTPPISLSNEIEKDLAPLEDRSRSSGWSKYFATSGPTGPNGISHLPAAYLKTQTSSTTTDAPSEYSSRDPSRPSQHIPSSILVPPLDIDFSRTLDGQRLSHVASASPSFSNSREDLALRGSHANVATEGQAGLIVNPARPSSARSQISGYSLSSNNNRTTLSSNLTSDYYNESGHVPWTPTNNIPHHSFNREDRPTSSQYTASIHEPRVPSSRGKSAGSGFFPGAGTSYRPPPKHKKLAPPTSSSIVIDNNGNGNSNAGPSAPTLAAPAKPEADNDSSSTLTVFPRGVPSAYNADPEGARGAMANDYEKAETQQQQQQKEAAGQKKEGVSDMSWLNLGLSGGGGGKI